MQLKSLYVHFLLLYYHHRFTTPLGRGICDFILGWDIITDYQQLKFFNRMSITHISGSASL